jgi:hypothetical protein
MGEPWWIYASVTFGHWGMNRWLGRFSDQLDKMRPKEPAATASVPIAQTPVIQATLQ